MAFFRETDVPGIGKKIVCKTHSKENISLIVHHDGIRELYIEDKYKNNSSVILQDDEARRLGIFLSGMMYKPKTIEDLEVALEGIVIDWFKIPLSSKVIGLKIGDLDIRRLTNVSIIAILRKDESFIANPGAEYIFTYGDTCVVIGKADEFKKFIDFIR